MGKTTLTSDVFFCDLPHDTQLSNEMSSTISQTVSTFSAWNAAIFVWNAATVSLRIVQWLTCWIMWSLLAGILCPKWILSCFSPWQCNESAIWDHDRAGLCKWDLTTASPCCHG